MTISIDSDAVLLVIDVQAGFDHPSWGERNNPEAEANIAQLGGVWAAAGRPIVRVRHASTRPDSPLRPDAPGFAYHPVAAQLQPALEITKSVHSAFLGTPDLGDWLKARGARQLVITGIQTNRCCETTARMAGDLGYDVLFAIDATYTFSERGPDGALVTADDFARATAGNIHGNFGTVVRTRDLIG
ncbi:MAG TPA: cysteine hydrolase family protein [Micromonosporaceae bacterium]|nr:cysteine hydrolase family protein [Micromonosporaceae bacterium]